MILKQIDEDKSQIKVEIQGELLWFFRKNKIHIESYNPHTKVPDYSYESKIYRERQKNINNWTQKLLTRITDEEKKEAHDFIVWRIPQVAKTNTDHIKKERLVFLRWKNQCPYVDYKGDFWNYYRQCYDYYLSGWDNCYDLRSKYYWDESMEKF